MFVNLKTTTTKKKSWLHEEEEGSDVCSAVRDKTNRLKQRKWKTMAGFILRPGLGGQK